MRKTRILEYIKKDDIDMQLPEADRKTELIASICYWGLISFVVFVMAAIVASVYFI